MLRYFKGQSEVEHFSLKSGMNALVITALFCKTENMSKEKETQMIKPKYWFSEGHFIALFCSSEHCCHCFYLSQVRLFATPGTIACQVPLSMEFPRQEYWSGLSFPSPGDLLSPSIEPICLALQVDSLQLSHLGSPKPLYQIFNGKIILPAKKTIIIQLYIKRLKVKIFIRGNSLAGT